MLAHPQFRVLGLSSGILKACDLFTFLIGILGLAHGAWAAYSEFRHNAAVYTYSIFVLMVVVHLTLNLNSALAYCGGASSGTSSGITFSVFINFLYIDI